MASHRDLAAALDARPIGALQWRVLALCTLVILLDGFDVQAIAFTAPAIARDWRLAPGSLGPVFAAGLVGMAAGALAIGPLGDRYGRRAALLGSVLAFGVFTLATAFARGVPELIALRVLTGLGLGGALPNATALMTEYAPARRRALAIAVIFLGIPLGGMLGGVVANALVPRWGWPAVFILGGAAPLVLLPVLALALPESVRFLLLAPERWRAAGRALAALGLPGTPAQYAPRDLPAPGAPVRRLFEGGRTADTLKVWGVFFFNLMAVYFLISWIPTLLVEAGHGLRRATQTSVLLNLGGAVG
jgi:MFS transporter, AAHS family, 4-hydroxybenzoate transporter